MPCDTKMDILHWRTDVNSADIKIQQNQSNCLQVMFAQPPIKTAAQDEYLS